MAKISKRRLWRTAWRQLRRIKLSDLKRYVQYYDEHKLESLLTHSAGRLGATILMPVLRAYYTLKSPQTPKREKIYIIGALGYFILPTDLFPDFFGLLGYADDLAVLTFILQHVNKNVTDEIELQAADAYARLLRVKRKPKETSSQ